MFKFALFGSELSLSKSRLNFEVKFWHSWQI